jgi:amidase
MTSAVTVHDVGEAATRLGISIDSSEVESYRSAAEWQLDRLETFMNAPSTEPGPEARYSEREPGHFPSDGEDPYRAWVWKCQIRESESGVLAGKTVGFKDHICVAGVPQSFGSSMFARYTPDVDATVVARVLAAGGEVVGKNSMNGMMEHHRTPLNPRAVGRTSGGSSSGSAVAVAAGEVDISIGGDQGGSIRIPAAYCGVLGLKPTFGLVSNFGVGFGFEPSLDHVGPIARTVEDLAAALEAVAGVDGLDWRQSREVPTKVSVISGLGTGIDGLRVGILSEGFSAPIDPSVSDVVMSAIQALQTCGAVLRPVSIPKHLMMDDAFVALALEGTSISARYAFFGYGARTRYPSTSIAAVNERWGMRSDIWTPSRRLEAIVAELSRDRWHGGLYAKAHNLRGAFIEAYNSCLQNVDVLAMPTVRHVAPAEDEEIGEHARFVSAELAGHHWAYQDQTANTKQSDYTGHPALTIPCGRAHDAPVGLQLIGRFYEEDLLLRVARSFQDIYKRFQSPWRE